jgi:hypothetical protein
VQHFRSFHTILPMRCGVSNLDRKRRLLRGFRCAAAYRTCPPYTPLSILRLHRNCCISPSGAQECKRCIGAQRSPAIVSLTMPLSQPLRPALEQAIPARQSSRNVGPTKTAFTLPASGPSLPKSAYQRKEHRNRTQPASSTKIGGCTLLCSPRSWNNFISINNYWQGLALHGPM